MNDALAYQRDSSKSKKEFALIDTQNKMSSMNKQTQEYTAVIIRFFLRKKLITFKVEDVVVPVDPNMRLHC